MDALETQLLIEKSKVKSPGFAAVLGFFFPWAAAFYNGKTIAGLIFLVVDLVFFLLSVIGIGFVFLLLYGFFGAYINHKWATEINQRALQELVTRQKATSPIKATGPIEATGTIGDQ